ncbi:MAG: hypothetical protein J7M25_05105 [Deltaproteobacteria bacterium]|nr:hypothetical protein [Deltaproteobacteria bacterium]
MKITKTIGVLVALLSVSGVASATGTPAKHPPGPAVKMKLLEVFPTQNYTVVTFKFYDAQGKVTKVLAGEFSYWSNFLNDRRAPASKRKFDLNDKTKVSLHLKKYTIKLPGFKRLCPPRVARLRVTFKGQSPKKRFTKTWKKKAQCHH